MRTETIEVTPALAEQWLSMNTINRPVQRRVKERYATELKAGRWRLTHQGIAFFSDGTLADGQHRLLAIKETGIAARLQVTFGMSREDGVALDGGAVRKVHEIGHFSGIAPWAGKDHVAVARLFVVMLQGQHTAMMAAEPLLHLANKYRSSIEFGVGLFPTHRKNLTSAVMMAAVGAACKQVNGGRLREFATVIFDGVASGKQDLAAIRVREWLLSSPVTGGSDKRIVAVKRIQRAIRAFVRYEPLSRIYEPSQILYPPKPDEGDEGAA